MCNQVSVLLLRRQEQHPSQSQSQWNHIWNSPLCYQPRDWGSDLMTVFYLPNLNVKCLLCALISCIPDSTLYFWVEPVNFCSIHPLSSILVAHRLILPFGLFASLNSYPFYCHFWCLLVSSLLSSLSSLLSSLRSPLSERHLARKGCSCLFMKRCWDLTIQKLTHASWLMNFRMLSSVLLILLLVRRKQS